MSTKVLERVSEDSSVKELRRLILYNSSHIWDDVISQLNKATGYDVVHCEQIAIIAHTKGKATVKSGDLEILDPVNRVLKEINLVTTIE